MKAEEGCDGTRIAILQGGRVINVEIEICGPRDDSGLWPCRHHRFLWQTGRHEEGEKGLCLLPRDGEIQRFERHREVLPEEQQEPRGLPGARDEEIESQARVLW